MTRSIPTRASDNPLGSRRGLLRSGLIALGAACLPVTPSRSQQTAAGITTTDLNGLALLQGAGCNVVAVPGADGALMIDGGTSENAEMLLDAVLDVTGSARVHTLINTHWHAEQIGANELVTRNGGRVIAHEKTRIYLGNTVYPTSFDERREALPESALPTQTVRSDGALDFTGARVDYGYLPQAHTDGDLYVHFPEQDVLAAGGVVSAESWPLLEIRNGAWFGGRVRALQWLAQLVSPATRVVPADGPLLTGADIVRLRDIYDELFETMIDYMNRGFGPEDAAADAPLAAFDNEFGDASDFVYGAYRSMLIAYVPE